MSKDYLNNEEYSEYQKIIKKEEVLARLREIICHTNDMFIAFINWLARCKDWKGSEICSVVEKPHHYKKEYEQFITEYWEKL